MRGIGDQFDRLLDDSNTMDDELQALSCTTEGDVSSSAQSPRRNARRRRRDKDTGPPEVLDDRTHAVSNHPFAHWHPTLVEMNASIPLQGAADLVDSTWPKVRSIDKGPGMEHSSTGVGAGAMLRRWLDATRPDDPFCCWTMRTKQIGLGGC